MKNVESNPYVILLNRSFNKKRGHLHSLVQRASLRASEKRCSIEQATAFLISEEQADLYPSFFLTALGDALSKEHGWVVKGMDAIVFALTQRYGWMPEEVRKMAPRDQWLAISDQAQKVALDPQAREAWEERYQSPLAAPELAQWSRPDGDTNP
ncbi:hypothetical protein [Azotobacter vinelandii]|uniref:hypothetical protein n=1 Tax=Azotobacter vinelandii TaxID=354 RepID=UPI0011147772|nr:hypothetical protein [Azotobacter vinelandii]WKN23214.1 hypothetical protein AVAEIV_001251 [Azotobacter vinelandii]